MSEGLPPAVERAFEHNHAFDHVDDGTYRVTTTTFEGTVGATDLPDGDVAYTVTVRAPTLQAATVDEVGESVAEGWFDTLALRLEDAPKATRATVELDQYEVAQDGDAVVTTYQFELANPNRAADVAKAFVEYVEGTYVEGVIPGYEYEGEVADLLGNAQSGGADGSAGGTPL